MTHDHRRKAVGFFGNWAKHHERKKMTEEDLRDCFAMFALVGIIFKSPLIEVDFDERRDEYGKAARGAYDYADAMLEARKQKEEINEEDTGIAAVAPKRSRRKR